jgi:hypothetical protein
MGQTQRPIKFSKHTTHSLDWEISVLQYINGFLTLLHTGKYPGWFRIKLPAGDFKYQDYFYRKEDSTVLAPVDQAIQLGDGGTGITLELGAFYFQQEN